MARKKVCRKVLYKGEPDWYYYWRIGWDIVYNLSKIDRFKRIRLFGEDNYRSPWYIIEIAKNGLCGDDVKYEIFKKLSGENNLYIETPYSRMTNTYDITCEYGRLSSKPSLFNVKITFVGNFDIYKAFHKPNSIPHKVLTLGMEEYSHKVRSEVAKRLPQHYVFGYKKGNNYRDDVIFVIADKSEVAYILNMLMEEGIFREYEPISSGCNISSVMKVRYRTKHFIDGYIYFSDDIKKFNIPSYRDVSPYDETETIVMASRYNDNNVF